MAHRLVSESTAHIGAGNVWKASNVHILNFHTSKKIQGMTVCEWNDVCVTLIECKTREACIISWEK